MLILSFELSGLFGLIELFPRGRADVRFAAPCLACVTLPERMGCPFPSFAGARKIFQTWIKNLLGKPSRRCKVTNLFSTVALARCKKPRGDFEPFQRLRLWQQDKPLKRFFNSLVAFHRAKATVVMRSVTNTETDH